MHKTALPAPPVIFVAHRKGGVGKTEVSIDLSEYFVLLAKKRVLGIDLDPAQANYSQHTYGMDLKEDSTAGFTPPPHPDFEDEIKRSSIADLYYGESVYPYPSWIRTGETNNGFLDVLLSDPDKLEHINDSFKTPINRPLNKDVHNSLKNFIEDYDEDEPDAPYIRNLYDLCIIDVGPGVSPLFNAALRAATHIIIPFIPTERDFQGIVSMLSTIKRENLQRPNDQPQLELIGLLPNMIENPLTKAQNIYISEAKEKHSDILFPEECWMQRLAAFTNRDTKNANPNSIFELPDSSKAKQQALAMAKYVDQTVFKQGTNICQS